jgi:hypothetical protein
VLVSQRLGDACLWQGPAFRAEQLFEADHLRAEVAAHAIVPSDANRATMCIPGPAFPVVFPFLAVMVRVGRVHDKVRTGLQCIECSFNGPAHAGSFADERPAVGIGGFEEQADPLLLRCVRER